ncbi:MAG TPA: helix-turn-helix transcriptional regulator [Streptosporangiaceae bacterium]|jgi:DNA-binding PadR family transcriptional regulator
MSPVFRHGRLRLYLLKLLDDAPKHGYEVIRLLQDRFMGVYAPSPGTIYPRLARLEEEGLVTHDEVEGKKVYRLTDKGRAEIHERVDDLAELEEEITESVRDIAREVKEDVRETVRNLREEIARAAKDVHREGRRPQDDFERIRDQARRAAEEARDHARQAREEARRTREEAKGDTQQEREDTRRDRDVWRRETEEQDERGRWEHGPYGGARRPHEDYERAGEEAGARFRAGRGKSKKEWGDWSGLRDWPGWRDWSGLRDLPGWRDWPGGHDWPGSGRLPGWPDPAKFRDLERLALQFAAELRRLASHASAIGEDTFGDLRTILDEALTKIKTEIFEPDRPPGESDATAAGDTSGPAADDSTGHDQPSEPQAATGHDQPQESPAQGSAEQAQTGTATAHESTAPDRE